jgi:hypothetical protein
MFVGDETQVLFDGLSGLPIESTSLSDSESLEEKLVSIERLCLLRVSFVICFLRTAKVSPRST